MYSVDLNNIEISNHFYRRCKERTKIPKRAIPNFIKKALLNGVVVDDIDHDSKLYNIINSLVMSYNLGHLEKNRFAVLYRDFIIIFEYPNIAVTIIYASEYIINMAEKYIRRNIHECSTTKVVS